MVDVVISQATPDPQYLSAKSQNIFHMYIISLIQSSADLLQMMKDVPAEQAERIFRSCDQRGDGRISLAEFRSTIQRGKEKLKSWEEAIAMQTQQQTQGGGDSMLSVVINSMSNIISYEF